MAKKSTLGPSEGAVPVAVSGGSIPSAKGSATSLLNSFVAKNKLVAGIVPSGPNGKKPAPGVWRNVLANALSKGSPDSEVSSLIFGFTRNKKIVYN